MRGEVQSSLVSSSRCRWRRGQRDETVDFRTVADTGVDRAFRSAAHVPLALGDPRPNVVRDEEAGSADDPVHAGEPEGLELLGAHSSVDSDRLMAAAFTQSGGAIDGSMVEG